MTHARSRVCFVMNKVVWGRAGWGGYAHEGIAGKGRCWYLSLNA